MPSKPQNPDARPSNARRAPDHIERLRADPDSILFGLTRAQAARDDSFVAAAVRAQELDVLRCGRECHEANRSG